MQLKAYDVRKTLESVTRVKFKIQAPDFRTSYEQLQRVIQIKDIAKSEKERRSTPPGTLATDDTGEFNESELEPQVNQFTIYFLNDVLAFLQDTFTVVPWSNNRLVFNV